MASAQFLSCGRVGVSGELDRSRWSLMFWAFSPFLPPSLPSMYWYKDLCKNPAKDALGSPHTTVKGTPAGSKGFYGELCPFSGHLLPHPAVWASEGEGALERYKLGPPGFLGIFPCLQAPHFAVCSQHCERVQRGCGISIHTQSSAGQGFGQPDTTLKLDLTSKLSLFGAGGCARGWT